MSLDDFQRITRQRNSPRIIDLWVQLQSLRSCVSFMNTGAHPDDETSPMLAALGLRDGVKLSHACSTRGEGGQNALGLEVGQKLGVIRTREMERAAAVLNMTQYWLSKTPKDTIFDFGFSKSGKETLAIWGEKRTLERFVFILRLERPDIICPTFLDIPGQHGHHRAMTEAAFKAVKLAADPNAFPEQGLDAWQVKKIYLPAWSGAGDAYDDDVPPPPKTTQVDATGGDHVLGADYAQIGQWSRAFHQTQQMGTWVDRGLPSVWPLNLAWTINGDQPPETSIFCELPNNLKDLASFANCEELGPSLNKAQDEMDQAIAAWPNDQQIIAHSVAALSLIKYAKSKCPANAHGEIIHRLENKERNLGRILLLANQITCPTTLSKNPIRPGQKLSLKTHLHSPNTAVKLSVVAPDDWQISDWENGTCSITIPKNAKPSDCYPDTWFPDRANGQVFLQVNWSEGEMKISVPLSMEEPLQILPLHSASLTPISALVNISAPKPIEVCVDAIFPKNANVTLEAKAGWAMDETENHFALEMANKTKAGLHSFAVLLDGKPAKIISEMSYAHTGSQIFTQDANLTVLALDIILPKAKIAYIGGGSDQVDYWLRAVGFEVTNLTNEALEHVDFSEFDSILIGIFAFRTRPILGQRLQDLHRWVYEGGNLVTLYHRPWDNWNVEKTALAPLTIGKPSLRWRVTNQHAEVTHLVPDHPLLNSPNKITKADWQDWHKERGLYFASKWDAHYTPLLSMADPDEQPLEGSLLSGTFGKGRHTHTSLILHYQVEKLVPGAYRILANLLNPA